MDASLANSPHPPPPSTLSISLSCVCTRQMCIGPSSKVPPAVKPSRGCSPASHSPCSTGLVTPPAPPPLPPAPLTGKLGGEGSVQYVNHGRGARWPSHLNGTAFDRSELDANGWPTADCTMVIFDARPTGAWAPPIDDPEQRQADLSGEWTLVLTGQAGGIKLADPAIKGITVR